MIDYHIMLEKVSLRMAFIKMSSLSNDLLNDEWRELKKMQDSLYKLLKIQGKLK